MLTLDVRLNHLTSHLKPSRVTDGLAQANSRYGASSGKIWLDDVACTSSSSKLLQCSSSPIGSHSCSHSDEAGVKCEGRIPLRQ